MSLMKLHNLGVVALAAAVTAACSTSPWRATSAGGSSKQPSFSGAAIRITGSDTMVNLVQAWAERYKTVRPNVAVQVAGGGSGVGIAGLVEGLSDIAAASREMTAEERRRTTRAGAAAVELTVALDALAVYVHHSNPLRSVAIDDLAEIYGEGGHIQKWSHLGVKSSTCKSDVIIRISRQNSSGTYAYFREVVLGDKREYKLGSIDQSGSKDVVALVSRTPCAIGYSGIAYATGAVRVLEISKEKGTRAVFPKAETVIDRSYPIARRLYLYTPRESTGETKAFLDWVLGPDGQQIVRDIGFVPVREGRR